MRVALSGLIGLAVLAAASPALSQRLPKPPIPATFRQDGRNYEWKVVNGPVAGMVLYESVLARSAPETGHHQLDEVLSIACYSTRRGHLQVRVLKPNPGEPQIGLTMGATAYRVEVDQESSRRDGAVEGRAAFPERFFNALADADTISISYAGKTLAFRAPGEAAVTLFRSYCKVLDGPIATHPKPKGGTF